MKTKISHLGRSTVSVILAVMMILSTMLIGTVSNVEALTSTDTVYFVDNYGSWSSVNAYIWKDKEGNLGDWPGIKMTDTGSVTSDGKKIFSCYNENLSSKNQIIFNSGVQTENLTLNHGKLFSRTLEKNGVWKNIYQFSVASDLPSGCTSATLKNGSLAYEGDTVTVTVKVSSGHSCTGLQGVADASVTKSDDNTYSITFKATKDLENITPIVGEVKNLNLKVAVVKYADVSSKGSDKLSNLYVTYTSSNGSQSTTTMTRDADEAKVYFKPSNAWGKVVEFYLYDLVLPEGTTKFKLNKGNEVTVSDDVDYYAIYHYDGFKNVSFTESDRYYNATVTADTSVATGATASFTANPDGETLNDDSSSVVMYKYDTALTLSKSFDTEKYNFTKWSDGTTDFTEDSYTVKGDTALTAYFEKKESYKVTVESGNGGTAEADTTTAYSGQKVKVTVNADDNHVLDGISVKEKTSLDAVDCTKNEDGTYTFVMPDDDVNVYAKFREKNTYTVTVSSENQQLGTVALDNSKDTLTKTVKEGDKVIFTAYPKEGYALSGWTVNNESVSSTTNPYTITVNRNTTVVANFKVEDSGTPSGYYILWGKDASFSNYEAKELYLKDGKYYANFDAATDKISTKENCYFVFSTSNKINGVTPKETKVIVNRDTQNKFYFESNTSNISGVGSIIVPKIWNENPNLLRFKIIVSDIDSSNKKVTYSCEPTFDVAPADTVEITAKDGTIRAGYTDKGGKKTTAVLGDTTLSITTPDNKIIKASDSYKIDDKNRAVTATRVPNGSTVTVKTTIDPTATFAGHSGSDYYVKGFSVNGIFGGVLSQTAGKTHDSYEYTYTFKVNQEIYGSKLEITPVYFLKDDANCVYFYIENYDSAKQIWGNTPSCYVYYGSGKTTLEALGYYPGQPMVDYNGSIFTQIPKSIVSGGATVNITGMTLNNYVWDDVHSAYNGKDQKEDNAQTYDYDDFVKIAESGAAAENIIYRFKYNTHDNKPKDTLDTSDTDADGWEVFLDYQNYPTDIFGNRIGNEKLDYKDTKSVTSKGNYLSIISDGYQNNYIGKYATAWSIYNKDGDRVATIPSSALLYALGKSDEQIKEAINLGTTPPDFLPGKESRDTYWKTFKTLYQNYKDVYARINFEAAIKGGDEKGNRLDGRWYYTQSKQKITGEIKIQYANTLDDYNKVGGFQEDTFENASSIVGTTTGASAYFTDPENKVRKLETEADNTQDYKFEVTATPSTAAYTFVGWYRLIDGDYKAINPSDMSSLTGAVTRNSDVTLVARYIKTPGGSMTFNHSLYKGENAGGGKATTEIQVVVKNNKGELLYNSEKIAGTASIDKTKITELAKQPDLTVTVTLYTTTKNLYNFNGYYSAENTPDITAFAPTTGFIQYKVTGDRKKGLVTKSEYTFSFNEYYAKHKDTLIDNAGTVYYNFYSDITSIKVPYKVQFSYKDRMEKQKYYNKAGYVDPENTSSYTIVEKNTETNGEGSKAVEVTLTNSFILSLAPYESNFTKNLTWNETPVSNTAFDSSDSKSIASAVVNSTQSDKKIYLNVYRDKYGVPTPRTNTDGTFELFKRNNSAELPYGSVFYTDNGDGTYEYDITAPKTYEGKQFMYWAIYSDPDCKNLVINAYNSEGHFSYVAYDNCWIVPVYGKSSTPVASVKEVYTSTQFMEVTRNQWTAATNSNFEGFDADNMNTLDKAEDFIKGDGEDKLYADFVLNFFYNGKQLSVFDPNSDNVKAGVLIQRLKPDENETGTGYITDLDYYANKKFTSKELADAEKDAIDKITTGTSTITSVKQQINNSRLDNKNRLQYYTRFNNVVDNSNYVFRLYTYIQYTDANGKQAVQLSDPVYFTFYDIANKS